MFFILIMSLKSLKYIFLSFILCFMFLKFYVSLSLKCIKAKEFVSIEKILF